jgi:hypothetical protein
MERKVAPRFLDGKKYLELNTLPQEQQSMFSGWVSTDSIITDTVDSSTLVPYSEYEYWYSIHFSTSKDLDHLI